jgi:hypothetical protein
VAADVNFAVCKNIHCDRNGTDNLRRGTGNRYRLPADAETIGMAAEIASVLRTRPSTPGHVTLRHDRSAFNSSVWMPNSPAAGIAT